MRRGERPAADDGSGQHLPGQHQKLVLQAVDIAGFKSYHTSVRVGAPFGQFTCVVGPNGSGKSVVGEAICFALGGNSKMMRAKNLGSLVNNSLRVSGSNDQQAAAQVTVHFSIYPNGGPAQHPGVPATTQGYLGVRRRVTKSGISKFAICEVAALDPGRPQVGGSQAGDAPDKAATVAAVTSGGTGGATAEASKGGSAAQGGTFDPESFCGQWHGVSPEALRGHLLEYGIQTQAIDRFIVTQHRQAVNVQDPAKLAGLLELLIGTAGYQECVAALQARMEETSAKQEEVEGEVDRLELRRQRLAPEVTKWRRYEEERREHVLLQAQVLSQQAGLLARQAAQLEAQVTRIQGELAEASTAQASAKRLADGLLEQKGVASQERAAAGSALKKALKRVGAKQVEQAKAEVQLKAVQKEGLRGGQGGGGDGLGAEVASRKLQELEAESTGQREELERQQAAVRALEEEEATLANKVGTLKAQSGSSTLVAGQVALDALSQQLSAVAALISAHTLRQQQHQSAAAAVERELERHAAASQAADCKRGEAERSAEEHRVKMAARQGQLESKGRELKEARGKLAACQGTADELRREIRSIDSQLEQLQPPSTAVEGNRQPQGQPDSSTASRQSVDQAVAELAQQAQQGQLPGAFYGRLCNVARVAEPQAVAAVNAVIMESCNLSTCLVVATRAVARRVVDHFCRHRVGIVTCKILEELREPSRDASRGDALVPLQLLVEPNKPQAPGASALVSLMLYGWYMAPDKEAAVAAMLRDRQGGGKRRNIVTAQGKLFKADGELVGARQPSRASLPFLLATQFQPLGARAVVSVTELAEERRQLQARRSELAPRLQEMEQQAQVLSQRGDELAGEVAAMREVHRADAAALHVVERSLKLELKSQAAKLQQRGEQLRKALQHAKHAESAATEDIHTAQQQRAELEGRHTITRAEYEAAAGKVQGGRRLLKAESQLDSLRHRLSKARDEASASREILAKLSRKRQQLEKAAQAAAAAAAEAVRLQQLLQELGRGVDEGQGEVLRMQEGVAELQGRLVWLEKDWNAAVRSHEKATATVQTLRAQLREAQQAQRAKVAQLSQVESALSEAQQAAAQLEAAYPQQAEEGEGGQESAAGGGSDSRNDASAHGGGACCSKGESEQEEEGKGLASEEEGTAKRARKEQVQSSKKPQHSSRGGRAGGRRSAAREGHDTAHESEHGTGSESEGEGQERRGMDGGGRSMRGGEVLPPRRRRQVVDLSDSESDVGSGDSTASPATAVPLPRGRRHHRLTSTAVASGHAAGNRQPAAAPHIARSTRTQQQRRQQLGEASESNSDFEAGPSTIRAPPATAASDKAAASRRLRRATPAQATARKTGKQGRREEPMQRQETRRRSRQGRQAGGIEEAEAGSGGQEWGGEAVEQGMAELERRERSMEALKASLAEGAVEQDEQAGVELAAKLRELDALDEYLHRVGAEKDALESERYSRFHAALQSVNAHLSGVYQQLTGGQGDAYCSYIEDRLAAFTEGVTFHVRPDSSRWRPFGVLSGGQQALATLALCFALQSAFPSPFYFFDEIDCALDTVNAGRVADYICSQKDAQYLVVSHKPQVYERASCLVGVYMCGAGSDAVTAHFSRES